MFVTLCLVGVWMMTSSSIVPVQNIDVSSQENMNEVKEQVDESNGSNEISSKQFEDNPGDLPEDATKGDSDVSLVQEESNFKSQENSYISEKKVDRETEENQEEKPEKQPRKESIEEENNSEDAIKTETENGGKTENGESKTEDKDSEAGETKTDGGESNSGGLGDSEEGSNKNQNDLNEGVKKSEANSGETKDGDKVDVQIEEKVEENQDKELKESSGVEEDGQTKDQVSNEVFPSGAQSELLNENITQNGAWSSQAAESKNENKAQKFSEPDQQFGYSWKLCNVTAGPDYIPCLDNLQAIRSLRTTKHYEHRERHCPEEAPTCLVPLPEGYQCPIVWPTSREKIWYHNVPHTKLAEIKGHQNWVKVSGDYLTFPGGGTQFKRGALYYVDFIQQSVPDIAWGKHSRVILDVGCGVASFGGYLFERDVLTISFAPKDEHEAQVQFALER
ncbi:hypothetical protein F0562_003446 [Nyssa sinensis]|uniref:Methyltransferase n=1 Tax=Nyssa sinensis TaxID=561372 RepID=A0A5J5BZD4_9ASTE|nr:hypothetical protein F0562_003446 [Nyssa sinensis]